MFYWLHREAEPSAALPGFISAGFGQLVNSDPKFGTDSAAFGERLGAAFLRQATMRFFVISLVPAIDHTDPRYLRKASGGYGGRALWATERAFVSQKDDGSRTFNNSDIFGHLAASALTPLYYPHSSSSSRVVMTTWATSIGGTIGNNLILEFFPDAINAWRRHHRQTHHDTSGAD